jgi:hypothetical protein
LHQFRRSGDEHVLHAVGGGIAITQHSLAEVVQPIGVAVVDRRERELVSTRCRHGEFGVVERVGGLQLGDGHGSPSVCRH